MLFPHGKAGDLGSRLETIGFIDGTRNLLHGARRPPISSLWSRPFPLLDLTDAPDAWNASGFILNDLDGSGYRPRLDLHDLLMNVGIDFGDNLHLPLAAQHETNANNANNLTKTNNTNVELTRHEIQCSEPEDN